MLFAERANEFFSLSLSKSFQDQDIEKSSVKSAYLESERDPKPSELAMDRVHFGESRKKARTLESFNALG